MKNIFLEAILNDLLEEREQAIKELGGKINETFK